MEITKEQKKKIAKGKGENRGVLPWWGIANLRGE